MTWTVQILYSVLSPRKDQDTNTIFVWYFSEGFKKYSGCLTISILQSGEEGISDEIFALDTNRYSSMYYSYVLCGAPLRKCMRSVTVIRSTTETFLNNGKKR